MPRKPKLEKHTVTVVLDGVPVAVTLHPPTDTRRSWYAYWAGLVTSRSTGQPDFTAAVATTEVMVRGWKQGDGGHRPTPTDGIMTDDEFEQIQRAHFNRKTDPADRLRAGKTLVVCLEAIRAFRDISGLDPVTRATPDDCARFQRDALTRPKNWRQQYPRGRTPEEADRVSPNTVLKWSRALAAAFERANRNAGKKCIRGVVEELKLLTTNPWSQFDWIEGREKPIRQLDAEEINGLLDHLESRWPQVTVAPLLAKVYLWSAARQLEVTGLRWSSLRRDGNEVHFEVVGKWGVEKWFRIPPALFRELEAVRTDSPFVFAAYNEQLRRCHEAAGRPDNARRVGNEFKPLCLGDWFADRMDDWSATLPGGHAHIHVLRKTTLQYARLGEDINRQLAADARVNESVLMSSYVRETDEQLRQSSNRTYRRIVASFPVALASRMGFASDPSAALEERLRAAVDRKDWPLAAELTRLLSDVEPAARCG